MKKLISSLVVGLLVVAGSACAGAVPSNIGPAGEQLVRMSSLTVEDGDCNLTGSYLDSEETLVDLTFNCPSGHYFVMQTKELSGQMAVTTVNTKDGSEIIRIYEWNMKPWYKRIFSL